MKVTLPILYNSSENAALAELDIKISIHDNEVRQLTFYSIALLAPYYGSEEERVDYTTIESNGDSWICPMPKGQVEQMIDHEMHVDKL